MRYQIGDYVRSLGVVPEGIFVELWRVEEVNGNQIVVTKPSRLVDGTESIARSPLIIDDNGMAVFRDQIFEPDVDNLHELIGYDQAVVPQLPPGDYDFDYEHEDFNFDFLRDLNPDRGEGYGV